MVSTRQPTSKSSSPFSNPLVTVPIAAITIGIIVTCIFHSFFNSLARSRYLSFFSHSFSFILWSTGTAKSTILLVLFFFLLIIIMCGLLAGIKWSVCMLKSHIIIIIIITIIIISDVDVRLVCWGCRADWPHLCWGVRPSANECPWYDPKQSDGKAPVMQGIWECGVLLPCHRNQVHSGLER